MLYNVHIQISSRVKPVMDKPVMDKPVMDKPVMDKNCQTKLSQATINKIYAARSKTCITS